MRLGQNKRIFAFITNRCNNACQYCFVYDERPKEDMKLNEFKNLCEQGKNHFNNITFIGGEPLLHPQLYDFMCIALNLGYKISISTSGITEYTPAIEKIFSLEIDDVTISLDSNNEENNDLLRGKGSFVRAVDTAKYLRNKGIPFRFTSTVCTVNKNDIFELADFVNELGAVQLDIHVMSQKGRASDRFDLSISPKDWLTLRKLLDNKCYKFPFHISYPLMWYDGDELDSYYNYCDAQNGNRLSVMSNSDCYYCTIAIGFPNYKTPLQMYPIQNCPKLYSKNDNLCNVEEQINTQNDEMKYVCRFVKRKTNFI